MSSSGNFMEKLLDGAQVEWLLLGDVTQYEQPSKYLVESKNYSDEFHVPVLTAGKTFILGYTDETKGIYKASQNPVIIFDDFTTANKWVDFDFKAKSSAMKMITSSDENKFLLKYIFYWLNTLPSELIEGDHKRQWISNFFNKKIPIPCPDNTEKSLKIQTKIVRILDAFTKLTAELTAELTARKKQYNYYRDQLLSFKEGEVEWKTLGEVTEKIYSGGTPKTSISEYWDNGTIPWMSSGEVNLETIYKTEKYISESGLKNSSAKFVPKNSIVIALAGQGKTRGKVARTRINLTTNQSLASLIFDDKIINPDYVYHFLRTQYENLRQISSGGGTRGGLNLSMISSYKLPVPSLEKQLHIVSILDKFDALTNSISDGLPHEIKLRQKQYEYYRDLLLSFPKPEEVAI